MKSSKLPNFVIPRKNHSACVVDDTVYIIGGENADGPLASIEKYAN